VFWQDPNKADREFGEAVSLQVLSSEFQHFARLFYEKEDFDMKMGKGYRGRPNIGAVTLMADLERTIGSPGNGLFELTESMRADLKSDVVRVFVFGSVFGGTGAAGLPTIPELLRKRFRQNGDDRKLRFGCAMLTPYFTFEKSQGSDADGPAPDSDVHQVATQAALLHYAGVPPGYQHAYVVGAPELLDAKIGHQAGGEGQENDAHYAEIVAALGARDFFTLPEIGPDERQLHYADAPQVGWDALPAAQPEQENSRELKRRLVAFTTFAYLYKNVLHEDMKDGRWRSQQAWYKDNFIKSGLALDNYGQTLDVLRDFCEQYLSWLVMVGQALLRPGEAQLFNWSALSLEGDVAVRELGRLIKPESEESPRYARRSYGKLMEKLNRLTPSYSNKAHPVGLLTYLLYQAALEFSVENYYLK
ncbi:MAG: hypothetical protein M3348_02155, partial [Acidobacteriota bacterium]|nr:hypothetical protein [Acidobacteriota bacterium]